MVDEQHVDNPQQQLLLRVCRIGRAQGLKGEVNVFLFTDEPERRFEPGSVLQTEDGSRSFTVVSSRTFKNRWIVLFKDVENRDESEALNGIELYGEADDAEDMLEEDAWYPKDLIGLEVRLAADNTLGLAEGLLVGKVVDVIDSPAQSLLKVRLANPTEDERTSLVPFVEQIVPEIDLESGFLTLDPPRGLIAGL